MANTATTTRIKGTRTSFIVLCVVLAFFAVVNLLLTMTPAADLNDKIDAQIDAAVTLPAASRPAIYNILVSEQEKSLAHKPAEPYGWSRLAYLRYALQQGDKPAFDALKMSDLVSPYEAPQLPERALMWHNLRGAQNATEQAYQDDLWTKAFDMERDKTWVIAVQNSLTHEVEDALKKNNQRLYDEWKMRENQPPIKN